MECQPGPRSGVRGRAGRRAAPRRARPPFLVQPARPGLMGREPQAQPPDHLRRPGPDPGRVRHGRSGQQAGQRRPPFTSGVPSGSSRDRPGASSTTRSGPASEPRIRMNPHGASDRLVHGPPGASGIGALERDRHLGPAHVERHHDPGPRVGLLQPGRGQVADADGGDDAVVGRALRVAPGAVRAGHGDLAEPGAGQVLAGRPDQFGVDVDAGHLARGADDVADQRGVVAGPGADLEHPVARAPGPAGPA